MVANSKKEKNVNIKLFYKKDVIVYGLLILFICSLFFAFILPSTFKDKSQANGVKITVHNQTILTHSYGTDDFNIDNEWKDEITITEKNGNFFLTISFGETFNTVLINEKTRSVKMHESTCSSSKDCKYLPEIKNSGSIYCSPHDLKITSLTESGYIPPIVG